MPWLKGQDKTEVFNKKNVKHNALKQRLIFKTNCGYVSISPWTLDGNSYFKIRSTAELKYYSENSSNTEQCAWNEYCR